MGRSVSRILGAISLFSGIRVLNIVCSLVRNKLFAVLVGPIGLGLLMLYNTTLDLVSIVTRMSMDQSAVRDIAREGSDAAGDTAVVVRRWSLWLGCGGMALILLLSPLLSYWMFDTTDKWWTLAILSPVALCSSYGGAENALMQGLGRLRRLAKSGAVAAVASTVVAVALIWWLRESSVIPVILAASICMAVAAHFYRVRTARSALAAREIIRRGRGFVKLGALMTLSAVVTQLMNYVFVLWLNHTGSTADLGLYQAGYTIINTYVGVVLTGAWVEYYPHLSAVTHSRHRTSVLVAHECELALRILVPVVLGMIVLDGLMVRILYAERFLEMLPLVSIGIIGVFFRATSWCMAFVILAKGDGAVYILTESLSAFLGLALNVLGYSLWRFEGLGVSYIVWYALYTVITYVVYVRRYRLVWPRRLWLLLAVVTVCAVLTLVLNNFVSPWVAAIVPVVATIPAVRPLLRPWFEAFKRRHA